MNVILLIEKGYSHKRITKEIVKEISCSTRKASFLATAEIKKYNERKLK